MELTARKLYFIVTLIATALAAVLVYVPAVFNLGSTALGYYPLGMIGLWGVPVALAISIATLVRQHETEKVAVKSFVYPIMYILIFCLLMIVIEMLVHSPWSYFTTEAGSRYSDFSIHAVFTFLGLPFATAMGLIVGAVALLLVKINIKLASRNDNVKV